MVVGANRLGDSGGKDAQGLVACQVPVGIVDVLEEVNIGQGDDQIALLPLGTLHLGSQGAQNGGAVEHTGQSIVVRLNAQLGAAVFQFLRTFQNQPLQFSAFDAQVALTQ